MDVLAVGGDRVANALWRAREGGAVMALGAAMAWQMDVFVLIGLNDVTSGKRVGQDVVGGVCALAAELKAGLRGGDTRIHILELPILPMYDLPGNKGMRKDAENINTALKNLSAEAGFIVQGWDQRLLSVDGMVMPQWLVRGSAGIHLNAEGYDVFARHLRSLIISESINGRVLTLRIKSHYLIIT